MNALVEHLLLTGAILSANVAQVMRSVDRANYVPATTSSMDVYDDSPYPIGLGQTISAPHMHAMALSLLEKQLSKSDSRALDVGSGSCYLSVAMCLLGSPTTQVIAIEKLQKLVSFGTENVRRDRPHLLTTGKLKILNDDGWIFGSSQIENIPTSFDAIHVGAAASSIPPALLSILKPGGRMIIPVGPQNGFQELYQIDKHEDGTLEQKVLFGVRYVPLVHP